MEGYNHHDYEDPVCRKTVAAYSQTPHRPSISKLERNNLMHSSRVQPVAAIRRLGSRERCPSFSLDPDFQGSNKQAVAIPEDSDKHHCWTWRVFSNVTMGVCECIRHYGCKANTPKLAAPQSNRSVLLFSLLVLEGPGLLLCSSRIVSLLQWLRLGSSRKGLHSHL